MQLLSSVLIPRCAPSLHLPKWAGLLHMCVLCVNWIEFILCPPQSIPNAICTVAHRIDIHLRNCWGRHQQCIPNGMYAGKWMTGTDLYIAAWSIWHAKLPKPLAYEDPVVLIRLLTLATCRGGISQQDLRSHLRFESAATQQAHA